MILEGISRLLLEKRKGFNVLSRWRKPGNHVRTVSRLCIADNLVEIPTLTGPRFLKDKLRCREIR